MTILTQLPTAKPVAKGCFGTLYNINGKAVKVITEGDYQAILEECALQIQAAEAGLAPKIHTVTRIAQGTMIVMDWIDQDEWFHPDFDQDVAPFMAMLPHDRMVLGLQLMAKLINAGLIHADYHTGNWFINNNGDQLAIDFGQAARIEDADEDQLRKVGVQMKYATRLAGHTEVANLLDEALNEENDDALRAALTVAAKAVLA